MNQKQVNQTLYKIRYHCQYLSLISHRKDIITPLNTIGPSSRQLSPVSVAKIIVQMTYLLYTCAIMNVDIYISSNPYYVKKNKSSNFQARLIFYMAEEIYEQNIDNKQLQTKCEFVLCKATHFNSKVLSSIKSIVSKIYNFLCRNSSQNQLNFALINKMIDHIRKSIEPELLNEPTYLVIKGLQKTELFSRNSDLLIAYRNSIFYQIKKSRQSIEKIKGCKALFQNKVYEPIQPKNYPYIYKQLDMFLLNFVNKQLFILEKSSTKTAEGLIVGQIEKVVENNKEGQRYHAKFYINQQKFDNYTVQKQTQTQQNQAQQKILPRVSYQRNSFLLEYSCENCKISLKNITFLQANQDTLDIIGVYFSNISFKDIHISLQNLDTIKTNSKVAKKYVGFKCSMYFQPLQQPYTKVLILIQYLSICTKFYMELLLKRPDKSKEIIPEQYFYRLDHLLRLFVDKATNFYKSL